jgi:hypothetical protein
MSVSYPSSTRLLLCIQSTSSRTPECFRFHPWNSSSTEWRCTPDRRRLYRMLWGKPPAEWCSSAKFSSHVSLFPVPIFGVNWRLQDLRCMKQRQVPAAISNGDSLLLLIKFETVIYFQKIVEKNIKRICGWHILQPTGKKCRVWSRLLCSCTSCWEIWLPSRFVF